MKNTLILSLLLGLTPLATAQTDTTTPPPAAQPADPNAQPAPPADPNAQPAPPADPNAQPAPPADPNAAPATPVDPNAAPATPVDPNAAPATPVDPNAVPATPVDPNAQPPTDTTTPPTDTTTTDTTTTTTAAPAEQLSAAQLYQRAQEQAAQAEVAYPIAFVDRTLWKAAVTDAATAAAEEPTNRDYASYAAQLYTKTQWWINAYNAWAKLGDLTDAEKDLASLAAAKLGYLALQRGDTAAAQTYITQGIAYRNTQSLQDLQKRLGQ